MWLGHDASWWGLVLAIAALVLMIPANIASSVLTPILLNWLASWSSASLEKRIKKLENRLAELEKEPAIDEVQENILWSIATLRMSLLSVSTGLVLVFYFGIETLADQKSTLFKQFEIFIFLVVITNLIGMFKQRYANDFRYKRSLTRRKRLRIDIDELKNLRQK